MLDKAPFGAVGVAQGQALVHRPISGMAHPRSRCQAHRRSMIADIIEIASEPKLHVGSYH
jgi:hypothetical protein